MKSIGFVGQMENNGLVLCVARLINAFGKRVIYIDATNSQRTRYTVPAILSASKQEQYVVQYDNVEVAVGFNNILELKKYMFTKGEDFNDFDYVLINTDREEMCEEYDIKNANNIFFTTTFDKYELNRGIDLLKFVCATKRREDTDAKLLVSKVLTYTQVKTADNKYVEKLADSIPVEWDGKDIILSYDEGDLSAYIQNQYSNKIEFKNLSAQTKDGIVAIVCKITGEDKERVKKAVKNVERISKFSN